MRLIRPTSSRIAAIALTASLGFALPAAAVYEVSDGKVQIVSSLGTVVATHDFTLPSAPAASKFSLSTSDVLRLTFTLSTPSSPLPPSPLSPPSSPPPELSEDEDGVSPPPEPPKPNSVAQDSHQVPSQLFVNFVARSTALPFGGRPPVPPRSISYPIKVRKSGKARYELTFSLREAPASLLSLSDSGELELYVLVGDANTSLFPATRAKLADLSLEEGLRLEYPPYEGPDEWEVERFGKRQEIRWTFREEQQEVASIIAGAGMVGVLAPWVFLIGAIAQIQPKLTAATPRYASFLLTLAAFEALILAYWTSLKLLQVLPWFGALGVVAFLTGREALSEIRRKSVGEMKPKTE